MRSLIIICVCCTASLAHADVDVEAEPVEETSGTRIGQPFDGERSVQLEVHGGAVWYGPGISVGVRLNIPLVDQGFVSEINNAIFLTFGFDFYYARHNENGMKELGPGFGVPFGMLWSFYFSDAWSAFLEVGLNIYFPPAFVAGGSLVDNAGGWIMVGVGGRWHFSERGALTVRLGTPSTTVGLMLNF